MRKSHNGAPVLDKAQDFYETSRERAEEGLEKAKSFIQAKPVTSAFLGLGLGIFLGMWLNRRD